MELIPRPGQPVPETVEQIATKTAMKLLRSAKVRDEVVYNRLLSKLWEVIIADLYRLIEKETMFMPINQD